MKIPAYDDAERPAIGLQLDEGVLPTGHADLRALMQAGPREGDRHQILVESPLRLFLPD